MKNATVALGFAALIAAQPVLVAEASAQTAPGKAAANKSPAASKAKAKAPAKTAKPAAKAAATAPAAGKRVYLAAPVDVVGAAKSCNAAITSKGVDGSRLTKLGWRSAPITGGAAPFRAYSKPKSPTIIMLPVKAGAQSCMVMSRLAAPQDVALVAKGLSAELGHKPAKGDQPGEAIWAEGDRAFQLLPTGTPQAPGVRIAVIHRQGK